MIKQILSFGLLIVFVAACQATPVPPSTGVVPTPAVIATVTDVPLTAAPASTLAVDTGPLYLDSSQPLEARVEDLLARMTLAEKIGQMTQVENYSITPEQVTEYFIGSVLSGGGSYKNNTPEEWRGMVEGYEQAALKTRLGIPLVFGVDAMHGHAHIAGATFFPQNIGLGATGDADVVERIGRATAEQVAATAIQWNFAPVVAVPQDIRWGRTYEGYGENTELVTKLGTAYVKGLQNIEGKTDLTNPETVLATPKHFVADGGTAFASSKTINQGQYLLDQGDAVMDETALRELFLPPYQAAIDAGAETVMASFSSWNGVKMHANKQLLTDVLKVELGFDGYVISDWQGLDQISPDYNKAVVTGINAGVDMTMVPYDFRKYITTLTQAVEKGEVSQERIDDAVRRILTVKFKKGLFEQPIPQTNAVDILDNAEHRALAREAVQKSLVLLKNDEQTLPLNKATRVIFVSGEGANRTGYQNGGWTIEWQGVAGDVGGTSILKALRSAVSPETRVEYNSSGNFSSVKDAQGNEIQPDVSVVVLAEKPYAEGVGDRAKLEIDNTDLLRLKRAQDAGGKVVVILLSGRPLVITQALPYADAVVAAWLPGTEGEGVTDVLFGDVPFTGKTPYSWPRSSAQLPFDFSNLPTSGCDAPLFPYGFGLTAGQEGPEIEECRE